jgi:uncharacterized Fe-S cluster protein YjdI
VAEDQESIANVEDVAGAEIGIRFEAALCIHFTILRAVGVSTFQKPRRPGNWIFPDAINAPALAAIARNGPSRRLDDTK